MKPDEMADLTAFIAVARDRSFTHAAKTLGLSQSTLSQIVRRLEARMGLRLLNRTTRSVAPTDAGERLLTALSPMLAELDETVTALSELRDKPGGNIRITATEHAAKMVLLPALRKILPDHPDIRVEISMDYGLTDIVSEQYDAGVRLGGEIEKDMIAVRIGPDFEMVVVGAPAYFDRYPIPEIPQDIIAHRTINLRLPSSGATYNWPFVDHGRTYNVRTNDVLVFNTIDLVTSSALDGHGLACIPFDQAEPLITAGKLKQILKKYSSKLPGYHLYYANRRYASPAFRLLVETLRYRG